jgi:transcriptional regulator with XRE-family HTH domain
MDATTVRSSNFLRSVGVSVFSMPPKRPNTSDTLARNLNFLMDHYGYSEREMEKRSGVSAKTINNMRNGKHKATIENTDSVAAVFGLDGWQMIIPGLPDDLIGSKTLKVTIANYVSSDEDGRKSIDKMAEREALYNTTKKH